MGSAQIFLKGFLISCELLFTPISEINTSALGSSSNHPRALKPLLIALRLLFVILCCQFKQPVTDSNQKALLDWEVFQ